MSQFATKPGKGRELLSSRLVDVQRPLSRQPLDDPTRDSSGIALSGRCGIGRMFPQRVRVVWREAAGKRKQAGYCKDSRTPRL